MAMFTMQLRQVLENQKEEVSIGLREKIDIGLNDYPIFAESYRATLNSNIVNHYMFREIGYETAEMFTFHMRSKMNLIMPKYNRMYEALQEEYEIFENVNYTESTLHEVDFTDTENREGNVNKVTDTGDNTTVTNDLHYQSTSEETGHDVSTDKGTSSAQELFNDTPMGSITDPYSDNYATTTTQKSDSHSTTNTADKTASGTGSSDDTGTVTTNRESNVTDDTVSKEDSTKKNTGQEETTHTKKGKDGSQTYTSMLNEYLESQRNIDELIIADLQVLFMGLFYNGEY